MEAAKASEELRRELGVASKGAIQDLREEGRKAAEATRDAIRDLLTEREGTSEGVESAVVKHLQKQLEEAKRDLHDAAGSSLAWQVHG